MRLIHNERSKKNDNISFFDILTNDRVTFIKNYFFFIIPYTYRRYSKFFLFSLNFIYNYLLYSLLIYIVKYGFLTNTINIFIYYFVNIILYLQNILNFLFIKFI